MIHNHGGKRYRNTKKKHPTHIVIQSCSEQPNVKKDSEHCNESNVHNSAVQFSDSPFFCALVMLQLGEAMPQPTRQHAKLEPQHPILLGGFKPS